MPASTEVGLDGRIGFVNDRLCRLLGYTREELVGKQLSGHHRSAGRGARAAAVRGAGGADGADVTQLERGYLRKDGSRLQQLERVSAIRDAAGRPVSLLTLSFDPAPGGTVA